MGIAKFSKKLHAVLFEEIESVIEDGKLNAHDTYAFTKLAAQGHKIDITLTEGLSWIEIDFIEEFEKAKSIFKNRILL